jgi:hypothetical protein
MADRILEAHIYMSMGDVAAVDQMLEVRGSGNTDDQAHCQPSDGGAGLRHRANARSDRK